MKFSCTVLFVTNCSIYYWENAAYLGKSITGEVLIVTRLFKTFSEILIFKLILTAFLGISSF